MKINFKAFLIVLSLIILIPTGSNGQAINLDYAFNNETYGLGFGFDFRKINRATGSGFNVGLSAGPSKSYYQNDLLRYQFKDLVSGDYIESFEVSSQTNSSLYINADALFTQFLNREFGFSIGPRFTYIGKQKIEAEVDYSSGGELMKEKVELDYRPFSFHTGVQLNLEFRYFSVKYAHLFSLEGSFQNMNNLGVAIFFGKPTTKK